MKNITLTAYDGKKINVYVWDEVTSPVGTIQIFHGMGEYAGGETYDYFARAMNKIGYVVYADDHRGHGLTDINTLGYAKGNMFEDTVKDEMDIANLLCERYEGLKHIVFAHSYGSFIAQKFMSVCGDRVDGVVLYGSAYMGKPIVRVGKFVAKLGCAFKGEEKEGKFIDKLSFGVYNKKFADGQWLSEDPDYAKTYYADPKCGFVCSNNFYKCFFGGLLSLYSKKYSESLNKELPVFIISGESDPVGDFGKAVNKLYNYYQKIGMKNVKITLVKNSRHVILGEKQNRDFLIGEVKNFIKDIK